MVIIGIWPIISSFVNFHVRETIFWILKWNSERYNAKFWQRCDRGKKKSIKLMSNAKAEGEDTRLHTATEKKNPTGGIIRADGTECKWPMQSIRETTLTLWWRRVDVKVTFKSRIQTSNSFFAREKITYANRAAETVAGFSFIKFIPTRTRRTNLAVTRVSGSNYFAYFSAGRWCAKYHRSHRRHYHNRPDRYSYQNS